MELDKIYNMDCLEGMKQIPDGSVDLIATDPPYILDNKGGGLYDYYKGAQYVKELHDIKDGFEQAVLDELCRIMSNYEEGEHLYFLFTKANNRIS